MRGLCSVRARRATTAALLAETFRRARVRYRLRLLRRRSGGLFDRVAGILQPALECLNAFADRRPHLRDPFRSEHEGYDRDQDQDVPNAEVCEHGSKYSPLRETSLGDCRIWQPFDPDGRALESCDHDGRLQWSLAPYLHMHGIAEAETEQLRPQLGPGAHGRPVECHEPVPAVQPRPAPRARRIRNDEAHTVLALRLPAPDAQVTLRLAVRDGGSHRDAGGQPDEAEVAVEIDRRSTTYVRVEERRHVAAAHRFHRLFDHTPVNAPPLIE